MPQTRTGARLAVSLLVVTPVMAWAEPPQPRVLQAAPALPIQSSTQFERYLERVADLKKCCVLADAVRAPDDATIALPNASPTLEELERFASARDFSFARFGNVIVFRRKYLVKTFPAVSAGEVREALRRVGDGYALLRHPDISTNGWFRQLVPTLTQEELTLAAKGELRVDTLDEKQAVLVQSFVVNTLTDSFGLYSQQVNYLLHGLETAYLKRVMANGMIEYSLLRNPDDAGGYLLGTAAQTSPVGIAAATQTLGTLLEGEGAIAKLPPAVHVADYLRDKPAIAYGLQYVNKAQLLKGLTELYGLRTRRDGKTVKLQALDAPPATDIKGRVEVLEAALPPSLLRYLTTARSKMAGSISAIVEENQNTLTQQCCNTLESGYARRAGAKPAGLLIKVSDLPPDAQAATALLASRDVLPPLCRFVVSFRACNELVV